MGGFVAHEITVTADVRYVRIALGRLDDGNRAIALIAHELQHAVEIANAPDVGRTLSVTEFFAAINAGGCTAAGLCYETAAALAVQASVMRELSDRAGRKNGR
jgi:hypothetical protein